MPRAALLSIHARVAETQRSTWEDPSLVQLWGPRYQAYVVAARDLAVFSLGRLPDEAGGRRIAEDLAACLHAFLKGRRMTYGEAGRALGEHPNRLRYAAPTWTVVIRWDGARQPTIWTVPPPELDARDARLELARRYLHVFGPATPEAFARWAGIAPRLGGAAFDSLRKSLTPVRTPLGDAWILTRDEPTFRLAAGPAARALDPSRLAGRRPCRGRDRRDVAACSGDGNDSVLAPSHTRGTRRGRDGSGGVTATRRPRASRRPLGRLTHRGRRPSPEIF